MWAPFFLVVLRLLQGLSTGGEWGGATLMAVENAKKSSTRSGSRRGFYGSLVMAASPAGLILSNVSILILTRIDKDAFLSWGWRIPFLVGGLIAVLGLIIRLGVSETDEFKTLANRGKLNESPVSTVIRKFPLRLLRIAFIYMGPGAAFYAIIIFGQKFAVQHAGLTTDQMTTVVVMYGITMFVGTLTAGNYVDRIGAARMGFYATIAMCVMTPIAMGVLASGQFGPIVVVYMVMAVLQAVVSAPMALLFTDMFDADVRYTGVSLGYQLGTVVGGALPPIVALWLFEITGSVWVVSGYLVAALIVSAICVVGLMSRSLTPK